MNLPGLDHYRSVWALDFEFHQPPGDRPQPICLAARELRSGRLVRAWLWQDRLPTPPYSLSPDTLCVSYFASAEWGCHLALDWPTPARILDLYAEFRLLTSGLPVPAGHGLLGALLYFDLDTMGAEEKGT